MRSEVLVIDTVVSLTLAKCETLSGQFGGNLSTRFKGQLVGITRTAGNSSKRDFLSAILSAKGATFASFGN
jgi:UDP-N-acetylmuramyl pentapeptide synthase